MKLKKINYITITPHWNMMVYPFIYRGGEKNLGKQTYGKKKRVAFAFERKYFFLFLTITVNFAVRDTTKKVAVPTIDDTKKRKAFSV